MTATHEQQARERANSIKEKKNKKRKRRRREAYFGFLK